MSLDFDSARLPNSCLTSEHNEWRAQLRRFFEREVIPFAADWDEDGHVAKWGSTTRMTFGETQKVRDLQASHFITLESVNVPQYVTLAGLMYRFNPSGCGCGNYYWYVLKGK